MKNFALGLLLIPLIAGCSFIDTPVNKNIVEDYPERGYATICGFQEDTTWISKFKECEFLEKERCEEMSGNFSECESACRHAKKKEGCIEMCVPVCSWEYTIQEEIDCKADGGRWEEQGILGISACISYYDDANKICTSSDECQGDCVVTEVGGRGFCAKNNSHFGCKSTIEAINNGEGILCGD